MNLNFNEICRLCLRFCEEYVDLNQTNGVKTLADDLVEKIKYCYVIQIDLSEGYPTKVCYECIQVLSFFYTAKKNVIISDQLLRDILFVRKGMQEGTRSHEEDNVTSPDIIEIKQIQKKNRSTVVIPQKNELKEPDQNRLNLLDIELCCSKKCISNPESCSTPIIDTEKEIIVCDANEGHISVLNNHNSKVKKKKKLEHNLQVQHCVKLTDSTQSGSSPILKSLGPQNSNVELVLKFRDLKKDQCQRPKNLKSMKDKKISGGEPPLGEFVVKDKEVKEIGTVIDTNNILSPDIKRTRKSVSAR